MQSLCCIFEHSSSPNFEKDIQADNMVYFFLFFFLTLHPQKKPIHMQACTPQRLPNNQPVKDKQNIGSLESGSIFLRHDSLKAVGYQS